MVSDQTKFKVGDKVRVAKSSKEWENYCDYLDNKIGWESTIEEVCVSRNNGYRLMGGNSYWWPSQALELVEPPTPKPPHLAKKPRPYNHTNPAQSARLEAELGARGGLKVGIGNMLKAKSWLCAALGASLADLDGLEALPIQSAYNDTTDAALKALAKDIEPNNKAVSKQAQKMAEFLLKLNPSLDEPHLIELIERIVAEKVAPRTVYVNPATDKTPETRTEIGQQHYKFHLLLACIKAGVHVALIGGAGSGKTTTAENTAIALGLQFFPKSFSRMTTESGLMGYMDAGGMYHPTVFRAAFEHGGLFCGDEFDAGNENVNVALNAALSNGFCSFPDGVIKRHERFTCIICMNTYGAGGNRMYVGRNQLDAATLDRFVTIDWDIDASLEARFAGLSTAPAALNLAEGGVPTKEAWFNRVQKVRKAVDAAEVRHVVSPRAVIFGSKLIDQGVGFHHLEEMVLWKGLDQEQRERVQEAIA